MTIFQYKAVTLAGETIEGQYDVASSDDVIAKLHDAGNIPLEVRQADSGDAASLFAALFKRATLRDAQVVQFTQQLATLLGAGQPLDRALQILLDLPESDKAKRMFERIRDKVRGGDPLSDALEEETGSFSKLYVNIVRAGEAGGSLDDTLARLAEYLDRSRQLKSTVINAMIYPAFLVGMVMVSLLILLTYVVPQFAPMFTDMGVDMPLITRIVLAVGSTLQNYWWLLLILIFGAVGWVRRQLKDPERRLVFDQRLLRMKLIGDLIRKVDIARLSRTLGTLLKNGVPLLGALSISRNVMTNTVLAQAVGVAAEEVKTGGGLGYSLAQSKQLPKLAVQMISVGEESGELESMLMKVADTFDIEVKNTLDRLLAAMVPLTTVIMTAIVAVIMLAIVLPIMDLASSIR